MSVIYIDVNVPKYMSYYGDIDGIQHFFQSKIRPVTQK